MIDDSNEWRGDRGVTPLNPPEVRVRKDSQTINVLGALQELSTALGVARSYLVVAGLDDLSAYLRSVQRQLYVVKCDVASHTDDDVVAGKRIPRIDGSLVAEVNATVAELERRLGPTPDRFVIEAGSPAATALFLANEVARRAERLIVSLNNPTQPDRRLSGAHQYLNHLSYQLYLMARVTNRSMGIFEESISTDASTGSVTVMFEL